MSRVAIMHVISACINTNFWSEVQEFALQLRFSIVFQEGTNGLYFYAKFEVLTTYN